MTCAKGYKKIVRKAKVFVTTLALSPGSDEIARFIGIGFLVLLKSRVIYPSRINYKVAKTNN